MARTQFICSSWTSAATINRVNAKADMSYLAKMSHFFVINTERVEWIIGIRNNMWQKSIHECHVLIDVAFGHCRLGWLTVPVKTVAKTGGTV